MPSSPDEETQAPRREVTCPRSHRPGGSISPCPTPPPLDFFLKRGSRSSEVSGERNYTPRRLCLYQGWGLGHDTDTVKDKAGKAPQQIQIWVPRPGS